MQILGIYPVYFEFLNAPEGSKYPIWRNDHRKPGKKGMGFPNIFYNNPSLVCLSLL